MVEIRIHGRGGQGAVVASKVLASAVFQEGKYVQSFPAFGVERRGAPVTAFTRIDERPILLRCEIYEPDHLIVLDPTLIDAIDVTAGLKQGGWILINSPRRPEELSLSPAFKVATVDANAIAVSYQLGTKTTPIVNTAILGAFSKITNLVGLDSVVQAIREDVPFKKEENAAAAKDAYRMVIA
ncbi:MAG: 2-oxoacid:acceptor oxidoreductase family protein [candidate division KSB1 bacterium]|nr:2-oxoacid:acceptor oxidoreductase family protein [candidate division KSB1 bacterium]